MCFFGESCSGYPAVKKFDPTRTLRRDVFVMGGDQEAGGHSLIDRADQVHNLIRRLPVKIAGGLVSQNQNRIID